MVLNYKTFNQSCFNQSCFNQSCFNQSCFNQSCRKFNIAFLWSFFLLFWCPYFITATAVRIVLDTQLSSWLDISIKYLWRMETDIVYPGYKVLSRDASASEFTFSYDKILIASLILSILLALIAVVIDKKYHFLVWLRMRTFPVLYIFVARILALVFMHFSLAKIFVWQFEASNMPEDQMTPAGSFNSAGGLFFFTYGLSHPYEFILGALELLAIILLWIPRTVLLGSIIYIILTTNILLMDYFGGLPWMVLRCSLMLAGCIFLLAPEIKHYLCHFFGGTVMAHATPVFSLHQKSDPVWKTIMLFVISAGTLCGFLLVCTTKVYYKGHEDYLAVHADPMYGVWDATSDDEYIGKYDLTTVGIYRIPFPLIVDDTGPYSTMVSLLTRDKSAMAARLHGKSIHNTITFTIADRNGKKVLVRLGLDSKHELTAHYRDDGVMITQHYHRRSIPAVEHPAG